MDWIIRYLLGLPCRKQDREALQRALPELFTGEISLIDLEHLLEYSVFRLRSRGLHLRKWANIDVLETPLQSLLPPSNSFCPLEHCPSKAGKTSGRVGDGEDEQSPNRGSETILQLMTLGGNIGVQAASRTKRNEKHTAISDFRKLVGKVHIEQDADAITEIILTDPYLHMEMSAGGPNLLEYLEAIKLKKTSSATLKISPRIKAGSLGFKEISKCVNDRFRDIKIDHHGGKKRFHDRFFLVRYGQGGPKGVFGPSINALRSTDIFLMGELEPHCVAALSASGL